ncbi:MAG: hypothetical protein NXI22_25985, partial [bacterium]|nr:hypothetical protein [bacterium]
IDLASPNALWPQLNLDQDLLGFNANRWALMNHFQQDFQIEMRLAMGSTATGDDLIGIISIRLSIVRLDSFREIEKEAAQRLK